MSCILPDRPRDGSETAAPAERFGHLIGSVFRQWRRYVDEEFKAVGFTDATRTPIIALFEHKAPMRQKDLAARIGLDPSSLVRVLDLLRKRGLVNWVKDPEDKRTKCISITEEGQKWARIIIEKGIAIERQFLAEVTEAELAAARAVLKKIAERIPGS